MDDQLAGPSEEGLFPIDPPLSMASQQVDEMVAAWLAAGTRRETLPFE